MRAGEDKESAGLGGRFCSSRKSEERSPFLIYLGRNLD